MATILIVDDDDALRGALEIAMQRDGHAVSTAPSAPRAIQLIEEQRYDLVVCDVYLPGDGRTVLRRSRGRTRPVEVVMITGQPSSALIEEVEALEATLVEKPIDLGTFRRVVASRLDDGYVGETPGSSSTKEPEEHEP